MFLGRSTLQWTGLISAAAALIQVLIVTLLPDVDPATVAVIIGSISAFLGVLIAFIANTSTTPVADPQLKVGTSIRVTDATGTVIGHSNVAAPKVESGA